MINTAFVRVGEWGFVFELKTDYEVSTFDSATIEFTKPDGTVVQKTCDSVTSSAGEWGWVVTEDFFVAADKGMWTAALTVNLADGGGVRKSRRPAPFLVGGDNE